MKLLLSEGKKCYFFELHLENNIFINKMVKEKLGPLQDILILPLPPSRIKTTTGVLLT